MLRMMNMQNDDSDGSYDHAKNVTAKKKDVMKLMRITNMKNGTYDESDET